MANRDQPAGHPGDKPKAEPPSTFGDGSPLAMLVGPFYTAPTAATLVGVDVKDLPLDGMLRTVTSDSVDLYPTMQFNDGGLDPLIAQLVTLLTATEADMSAWAVALWLASPLADLDGSSVVAWLRDRCDPDIVFALARQVAWVWRDGRQHLEQQDPASARQQPGNED